MWNVITKDNKNYPNNNRFVVGYTVSGAYELVEVCRYDSIADAWFDTDNNRTITPDYWAETPETESLNNV